MEVGHAVWLVLEVQAILMRDEETGDVEVLFTGSVCLFNRELGFRSLNRGLLLHYTSVMHTVSDCVAGTLSNSASCLSLLIIR